MTDDLLTHGSLVVVDHPKPAISIHQRKHSMPIFGQAAYTECHNSLVVLLNVWVLKCHSAQ